MNILTGKNNYAKHISDFQFASNKVYVQVWRIVKIKLIK